MSIAIPLWWCSSLYQAKNKRKNPRDRRHPALLVCETRSELLKRVFEVDGWECPDCGKRMALRTVVLGAPASTRIVTGLLRATGPPAAPRAGDDQGADAGA